VGYDAIVLQHELDHLQGRLFIDRINKKDPWSKTNDLIMI
jgi:peptide deformylase